MDYNEISSEELSLLETAFKLYNISKSHSNIYKNDDHSICKNLILQYYRLIKPNHNRMVSTFKRKYVSNLIIAQENIIGNEKSCKKTVYFGRQTY